MSNCTSTTRLLFAKKIGLIDELNSESCAIGFSNPECFKKIGISNLTICHPEKSVIDKSTEINYSTFVDTDSIKKTQKKRFNKTFVNVSKSRKETFFNIAFAFYITKFEGSIFISGDNELGIDFFLRRINSHIKLKIFSKSHGRICVFKKSKTIPSEIKNWKNYGKYRKINSDFYTLPGCFSEKGIDKGSQLLAEKFSNNLYGKVVDLGAGWGYLSAKALKDNKRIKQIYLVESNLNALNCSRINIPSLKAKFYWKDIENESLNFKNFDHVIMNPPFHKGKKFRHSLVFVFLKAAKKIISKNGTLWMVYNKELSYEKSINDLFPNFKYVDITENYKIIKAINSFYIKS